MDSLGTFATCPGLQITQVPNERNCTDCFSTVMKDTFETRIKKYNCTGRSKPKFGISTCD